LCRRDVGLLTPFGPADEQDYEPRSIPAEINAVSGAEIQPQLLDAHAYTLRRRNIASFETIKRNGYSCLDNIVQLLEPSFKRIAPQTVNVLANLNHLRIVA
jgi:hypothetical protein